MCAPEGRRCAAVRLLWRSTRRERRELAPETILPDLVYGLKISLGVGRRQIQVYRLLKRAACGGALTDCQEQRPLRVVGSRGPGREVHCARRVTEPSRWDVPVTPHARTPIVRRCEPGGT